MTKPQLFSPTSPTYLNERLVLDRAKEIHASVYSNNTEHKSRIVGAYYTPMTTFDDPLVSVQGLKEITSQFMFLTLFPKIETNINSITATPSYGDSGQLVTIDANMIFTVMPFFRIPVRSVTHLWFDRQGGVIKHEDLWSFREVLSSVTGFGWMYDKWRRLNGYVTSMLSSKVFEGLDWWKTKRIAAKPKRQRSLSHEN
ncbi:hypothetical protein HDV05_006984 [Chytridiales sp. JEL 0842]|nr:hypothetical protein HDV05_006984 [Chytridiales sp. JEL 0842]